MQENISVTDSYSTGNAAQAMLEKLLQIYDVKTLVAQLNGAVSYTHLTLPTT